MCENIENIAARQDLGICYFPEQQARMDVLLYEISQADAEEVNTSTGKKRRFDISSAHGYAALSYALLPYAFVQDYSESNIGCNILTRMQICTQASRIIPALTWCRRFWKTMVGFVSFIAKKLKERSSRILREEFPQLRDWCGEHLWAPSCFMEVWGMDGMLQKNISKHRIHTMPNRQLQVYVYL